MDSEAILLAWQLASQVKLLNDKVETERQAVNANLTAIALLSTTAFGRSLLEAANAAGLLSLAGAGTAAVLNTGTSSGNIPILGAGGKLADSVIPSIAIKIYLGIVADQNAMLALVGEYGDWCVRSDVGKVYIITGADPTQAGGWTALVYPGTVAALTTPRAINGTNFDGTAAINVAACPPAVVSTASAASLTPVLGTIGLTLSYAFTAQAAALSFVNPSFTSAQHGQLVWVSVFDDGNARGFTWGNAYNASSDQALPTTSIVGKETIMLFRVNAITSKLTLLSLLENIG